MRVRCITGTNNLGDRLLGVSNGGRRQTERAELLDLQPYVTDPELVYDSKRMLGATFNDLATQRPGDTMCDIERWPFLVERSRTSPELPVVTGEPLRQPRNPLPKCLQCRQ